MRVAIGADHAGYELKREVARWVTGSGHDVFDVGASRLDPTDDYPDFAIAVGRRVESGKADRGIIVCGSGVGSCVAANKLRGVRASVCHDTYSAGQGVRHDALNVLCLGGRIVGLSLARELVSAFLDARYGAEERHARRLGKVLALERRG